VLCDKSVLNTEQIIVGCRYTAKGSFAFAVSPDTNVPMSANAFSLFVIIVFLSGLCPAR